MDIAILGPGNVGRRLAGGWLRRGHTVILGSRDPDAARQAWRADGLSEGEGRLTFTTLERAAASAPTVVLAVPWPSIPTALERVGPLAGQVVIDCTNPLRRDLTGLDPGPEGSAAEFIAARLPAAHVVKAFNTVGAALLENPRFGDQVAPLFYCGDDGEAKRRVIGLIEDLGFEPIDAGPLRIARYLEAFAMLFIHLAVFEGWREPFALGILRRPSNSPSDHPSTSSLKGLS